MARKAIGGALLYGATLFGLVLLPGCLTVDIAVHAERDDKSHCVPGQRTVQRSATRPQSSARKNVLTETVNVDPFGNTRREISELYRGFKYSECILKAAELLRGATRKSDLIHGLKFRGTSYFLLDQVDAARNDFLHAKKLGLKSLDSTYFSAETKSWFERLK